MNSTKPMMIAVAPNGARKLKSDHPALPILPNEIAEVAANCMDAGACMIHLHVRDNNHQHTLDIDQYRTAVSAIRARVGADLIVQITTEAVGIYTVQQQMQLVRELRPEAVSIALREFFPPNYDEKSVNSFFSWLQKERIAPQYILYSQNDIERLNQLLEKGILSADNLCILFVLGTHNQTASAKEILPLLAEVPDMALWSVCAFGLHEFSCLLTAAGLDGHCRVGFENNIKLISEEIAPDNAALVAQLTEHASLMGRHVMGPTAARDLMGMR